MNNLKRLKIDWQLWLLIFLLAITLLTINSAKADTLDLAEIKVDAGYTQVIHAWTDYRGYALFEPEMFSLGVTLYNPHGFGVRFAHGFMSEEPEQSGGVYKNVSLDFTGITSLELLYRYKIGNNFSISAGIGTYLIPLDHIYYENGVVVGGRKDSDNDEGYFISIEYALSKNFGLEYSLNHYSQIEDFEYIRGQSIKITYKF